MGNRRAVQGLCTRAGCPVPIGGLECFCTRPTVVDRAVGDDHNEPVAILISVVALLFSATVFFYNRRASRRDLLLRVHEDYLKADQQQGRGDLFVAYEVGVDFEDDEGLADSYRLGSDKFRSINHAVSYMDVMGYLFFRGYIPRRDAHALWGITVARVQYAAEGTRFLALRDRLYGQEIWPHLRHFAACVRIKAGEGFMSHLPMWLVSQLARRSSAQVQTTSRDIRYPQRRPATTLVTDCDGVISFGQTANEEELSRAANKGHAGGAAADMDEN